MNPGVPFPESASVVNECTVSVRQATEQQLPEEDSSSALEAPSCCCPLDICGFFFSSPAFWSKSEQTLNTFKKQLRDVNPPYVNGGFQF